MYFRRAKANRRSQREGSCTKYIVPGAYRQACDAREGACADQRYELEGTSAIRHAGTSLRGTGTTYLCSVLLSIRPSNDGHALLHIRQPSLGGGEAPLAAWVPAGLVPRRLSLSLFPPQKSQTAKWHSTKSSPHQALPVCPSDGRFSQLMRPWLVTQRPAQRGPGTARKLKQACRALIPDPWRSNWTESTGRREGGGSLSV